MSNQQHAPEPWISEGSFIGIPNGKGTFYMVPLSGINQDKREANARRIVACVNACAGIPTDVLEDKSVLKADNDLRIKREQIEKQRDELLSALKADVSFVLLEDLVNALGATNWSSWQTTAKFDSELSAARDFIASVKGGAS